MNNEIEKLQQARIFMDYLANGVDPVTNTDVNADTLNNEEVKTCFRYISDVLSGKIDVVESYIKRSPDFYITEEQISELKTFSYDCKVSELSNEINRVTEENGKKKLPATWINDWLEAEGYLCKSELRSRIATEKGRELGITSEYRKLDNGNEYYINLYSEQAQLFVFGHIHEILEYRNERRSHEKLKIQNLNYSDDISVEDFIQENRDKCFILSIGSCDSVAEVGSYISVLLYKGKSKVLRKSDITTNSANKCILMGILDAALSIKSPTDVIILSSTALGFNSPKSVNYSFCQEIYRILTEKECEVSVSVCQGRGHELNSIVKSFS